MRVCACARKRIICRSNLRTKAKKITVTLKNVYFFDSCQCLLQLSRSRDIGSPTSTDVYRATDVATVTKTAGRAAGRTSGNPPAIWGVRREYCLAQRARRELGGGRAGGRTVVEERRGKFVGVARGVSFLARASFSREFVISRRLAGTRGFSVSETRCRRGS